MYWGAIGHGFTFGVSNNPSGRGPRLGNLLWTGTGDVHMRIPAAAAGNCTGEIGIVDFFYTREFSMMAYVGNFCHSLRSIVFGLSLY